MNIPGVSSLPKLAGFLLLVALGVHPLLAQVAPEEIKSPYLRTLESRYMQDLIALNREVSAATRPFSFSLSRYVDADLKSQAEMDTRGLEFVSFHDKTILKFSGIYGAAFNSREVTKNQRGAQVFTDVVEPILHLLPQRFENARDFDAVGFEISYHVTQGKKGSEYEGKENLVVVMPMDGALRYSQLNDLGAQQKLLNHSEIYISGERFGLALGGAIPLPVEEVADVVPPAKSPVSGIAAERASLSESPTAGRSLDLAFGKSPASPSVPAQQTAEADSPALTAAEVDETQTKFQSALDQYGSSVRTSMSQTGPIAPSLALFRNALYLQITLKNPQVFDKEKTSLYKRAALSFDTFLAPHLGDLVSHLPSGLNVTGLDITVLVSTSANGSSSEAVEYIFPIRPLKSFVAYEISNQELIDKSLVIVNGVRISLSLQQVE